MATQSTNAVGSYEAKTHFSELLEKFEAGEEITITKHGTPSPDLCRFKRSTPKLSAEKLLTTGSTGRTSQRLAV